MNNISVKILLLAVIATVALSGCEKVNVMNQKLAYIDVSRVLKESSVGKQEAGRGEAVKNILLDAGNSAQEAYKNIPESERHDKQVADTALINQVWQGEQQHARAVSLRIISGVAEKYRNTHGLDLIISSEQLIASNDKYDVTDAIIKDLKDVNIDYGMLPAAKVSDINSEVDGEPDNK